MWVLFIGVNVLNFPPKMVWHMTLKTWNELFEWYKQFYNFKTQNNLFKLKPTLEEQYSSLEWFND